MAHALYVIHGSHPCACAEKALQLKGQPYRVVEWPPALHVPGQWWRFRRLTVPGLVLGSGEQVVGSRAIVHRLDQLVPEPPLLPADPALRTRVEDAERWGDAVLQPAVRRFAWVGFLARPDAFTSYAEGSRLPLPRRLLPAIVPPLARVAATRNKATRERARADLAALPSQLDQIDHWIAEGVLGGEQPNAADLQIGSSLRLLATFADVRPLLAGRPCADLGHKLFPVYPGELPAGALPVAA